MTSTGKNIIAVRVKVKGLVQGVGFRPYVYRLASRYLLTGWVANTTDGVEIKVEGRADDIDGFCKSLCPEAPAISHITHMSTTDDNPEGFSEFSVVTSRDSSPLTSEISPDIAVCDDCLADLKTQEHRIDYPFINCTACCPRFSIIKDFPYDRAKTTMDVFEMCPVCRDEYNNIGDRRFHAEPVACNNCGPVYTLHQNVSTTDDFKAVLAGVRDLLNEGRTIAVKGVGGYHLMCDAQNEEAVGRLRNSKRREGKPFAVMFRNIETVKEYALVDEKEEEALLAWQRPIVILQIRKPLARGVSISLNTIGAFLPFMPFHHILFENLTQSAVVLTSGNISEDPVIKEDDIALDKLTGVADALLSYNREIYNRTDDSVLRIISGKTSMIRRSRGYVPAPVRLPFSVEGIFAAGAELVNCFCTGRGRKAYMSQHIGDLKNFETYNFYIESAERFKKIFRIEPHTVVADLHPDYLSTRYALETGLDILRVQHHHAHIAACMAENRLDGDVLGVAFDGTGYGTDGHTWGSEFLICNYYNFERYSHFAYMPLPGGDRAAEEPWRMAVSMLHKTFGRNFLNMGLPLIKEIGLDKLERVTEALERNINCPLSSGAGRLFDAVAAISGICIQSLHHAEAPMRLEAAIAGNIEDRYSVLPGREISFLTTVEEICIDMKAGIYPGIISAKFHNTVVHATLETIKMAAGDTGLRRVVLSGGTFQNKYLAERLEHGLRQAGFEVFTHTIVPCNDGGLALGQLAIAAHQLIK